MKSLTSYSWWKFIQRKLYSTEYNMEIQNFGTKKFRTRIIRVTAWAGISKTTIVGRYSMDRWSSTWNKIFVWRIEDEESSSPGMLRKKLSRIWRKKLHSRRTGPLVTSNPREQMMTIDPFRHLTDCQSSSVTSVALRKKKNVHLSLRIFRSWGMTRNRSDLVHGGCAWRQWASVAQNRHIDETCACTHASLHEQAKEVQRHLLKFLEEPKSPFETCGSALDHWLESSWADRYAVEFLPDFCGRVGNRVVWRLFLSLKVHGFFAKTC